jgi:hypothetical protein
VICKICNQLDNTEKGLLEEALVVEGMSIREATVASHINLTNRC